MASSPTAPADRTEDIELELMQVKAIVDLIRHAHEAGAITQADMRNQTLEGSLYAALRGLDRIEEMLAETRSAEVANG
jgi:hypothetical protein